MGKWLDKMLDRICVVLGALLCMQAPAFFSQYSHRLSGHVNELKYQISLMQKNAAYSGKSLAEYLQKFVGHTDSDIANQGILMQDLLSRWHLLESHLTALTEASWYAKPFLFLVHFQKDIASATFTSFVPGLSFTLEEIPYAVLGGLLGYLGYALLKFCVSALTSRFRAAKEV